MQYTPEEVMQFVQEGLYGHPKNISIMPDELPRAFTQGIAIDASAIAGFGGEARSDLFLRPDPSTLAVLPWRPEHGRVVRMYCDLTLPDGSAFVCDTRALLRRAVEDAERAGVTFAFGAEMEFYLFKLDAEGNPTRQPYDAAGYMDIAPDDKGENVRREICLTLEQMGIRPESSHHEEGPGQNEIDFRYSDPLSAADNAITFQTVVRTTANRNGLYADFSPKPLHGQPGSGFHINLSACSASGEDLLHPLIAGVLHRIAEITVFLNPCAASYERLGSRKAPRYISWSQENRSQLVRVPAAANPRAELRSADGTANPYLAFALLIYAGLEGMQKGWELPEAMDLNLFTARPEQLAALPVLPASLGEAARAMLASDFVRSHLPDRIIQQYASRI